MAQEDDFKRTIVYGDAALNYIRKNTLPAYPRYYELWYTYSAGFNHSLNRAVNEVVGSQGRITTEELQQIYNRFLSPHRLGERIDQVGEKLSDEIRDMVDRLGQNTDIISEYGTALSGAIDQLQTLLDPAQLKSLIAGILKATQDTADANRSLENQLVTSRKQIESLQESLEAIRYESMTDELTTLNNRKHFDQIIERLVQETEKSGEPLSLLITDIDHFKQFNDNFGHQTGDQVLRLVALAVKQNVKGHDIACRYGGEEFAIILPQTSLSQAATVAEHIRRAVYSKELVKRSTGENLGRITITIGAAAYRPGDTAQSLIARADSALYAGKRAGRNQVQTDGDLDAEVA
ncbi:diguanylate cyclase [Stappia sp. F7233]|uniref:diguanylate cyclase n=1 Tax=Stappia albiluteola TaxID=2758565 RepID=A0A839ACF3_9HYPH|nr:GGDEF domain-containing protein [Stappia albiluteola]MBA5776664.1 diguanylate cyclase [Stappia albiluteola]